MLSVLRCLDLFSVSVCESKLIMALQSSTAPEIPEELPGDEPDDVLFNSIYGARTIELNRPKKLNSLNGSMARKILPRLKVCDCLSFFLSFLNGLLNS